MARIRVTEIYAPGYKKDINVPASYSNPKGNNKPTVYKTIKPQAVMRAIEKIPKYKE